MRRNGKPSLRITDCSDRELLALLADLEATEGYVDVHDIAAKFWPKATRDEESYEAQQARACITQGLAWLRHEAGLVEKHDSERRKWRLTDRGEQFLNARLRATQERAVDEADDDQLAELTGLIGERYNHLGSSAAWLVRREWQYRTARR